MINLEEILIKNIRDLFPQTHTIRYCSYRPITICVNIERHRYYIISKLSYSVLDEDFPGLFDREKTIQKTILFIG